MKNRGTIWILLGLICIGAAILLTGYNMAEDSAAGDHACEELQQLLEEHPDMAAPWEAAETGERPETKSREPVIPDYILNPNMEMPAENINGREYIGVLRIPDLSLELPVITEWDYPSMRVAPCRYSGSAYQNDLIIVAHNYERHFGKLKKLAAGDRATFTDIDGNVFTYELISMETLKPADIDGMEDGDWDLTLFTCTIGGARRVTLRFGLVDTRQEVLP